jgi:hypothetical protein
MGLRYSINTMTEALPRGAAVVGVHDFSFLMKPGAPRSVELTVHCVAPSLDAFDGLCVAATLYAAGLPDAGGSVVTAAEPTRIKTDVWMAADTAGLPDRASAGYGGSAKVAATTRLRAQPAVQLCSAAPAI